MKQQPKTHKANAVQQNCGLSAPKPLPTAPRQGALNPFGEKKALRKEIARRQAGLSPSARALSDAAFYKRLCELELPQGSVVFCYVSVGTEPDTRRYIEYLLQSGRRVCVPHCARGGIMNAREIDSLAQLCAAPFNLLEPPETAPLVLLENLALVVAPCITADKAGRRLGHGGGYYDRYLAKVSCSTVCLCRGVLLQERLPEEPFDVKVNKVLTEDAVYCNF